MASITDVAATTVLAAMITPAVLISASGTLILSTSQRLGRVVGRVRELSKTFTQISKEKYESEADRLQLLDILSQLTRQSARAKVLQRALSCFYISVGIFVATSVTVAFTANDSTMGWLAIDMGLAGAGFLLVGSLFLIQETSLAIRTISRELDFILELGRLQAPPEILAEIQKSRRRLGLGLRK